MEIKEVTTVQKGVQTKATHTEPDPALRLQHSEGLMFAKIFNQIFDSSIVENPELRFTFMDMLVLADINGVVDMTHEAIARRTNRPIAVIRQTISELENIDGRSRTPDFEGARIKRLDEHRDWGWFIVNFDRFRQIASEEQRREKTKLRVRKLRCNASVTQSNAPLRMCNDSPSASSSASQGIGDARGKGRCSQTEAEEFCKSIGLPRSDGEAMFLHWEEKGWAKVKDWKLTIRKWRSFGYLPSQKGKTGPFKKPLPPERLQRAQPEGWQEFLATKYPDARERDFYKVPADVQREFREWEKQ